MAPPRPRRRIANDHLRRNNLRTCAGIIHAALREVSEALVGRGAATARRLVDALRLALAERRPVDLRGTAREVALALGVEVSDRAAQEAVALLARELPFISAGGRHRPCAVELRQAWIRGCAWLEENVAPRSDPRGTLSRAWVDRQPQLELPLYTRACGDDTGTQTGTSDSPDPSAADLAILGVERAPGPPATSRQVEHLRRRGVRRPEHLTRPEAIAAQRRLRARRGLATLPELRRYWPTAPSVFEVALVRGMSIAQIGAVERELFRLRLQVAGPDRDAAILRLLDPRLNAGGAGAVDQTAVGGDRGFARYHRPLSIGNARIASPERCSTKAAMPSKPTPQRQTIRGPIAVITGLFELVDDARQKAGLTWDALAGDTGCSRQYLTRELAAPTVPAPLVEALAKRLGLDFRGRIEPASPLLTPT